MSLIDLRSDTVTMPTPEMRRAMADAEVGDDVFGEDPTVRALEERAAELLGKEAGLFVASGSMGNLVSQLAHLARGQETIAGAGSHMVVHDLRDVAEAFRDPDDPHNPITGLVEIENTHSDSMAQPLSADYTASIAAVAHERGVPLHVDGARFFNAVVALGIAPAALAGPADSVTFCLSKGLSCPVGSVVVGSREFIWRAHRARKLVGGGMRQAGVIAAPALVALRDGPSGMIERLAEDHANARRLAEGLADLDGIESPGGIAQPTEGRLDPERARTNFVLFKVRGDRMAFLARLRERGILMIDYPHGQIRAVTHHGIDEADVDAAMRAARDALRESGVAPHRRTPVPAGGD